MIDIPVNIGALVEQVVKCRLGIELQATLAGAALAEAVPPVAAAGNVKLYSEAMAECAKQSCTVATNRNCSSPCSRAAEAAAPERL